TKKRRNETNYLEELTTVFVFFNRFFFGNSFRFSYKVLQVETSIAIVFASFLASICKKYKILKLLYVPFMFYHISTTASIKIHIPLFFIPKEFSSLMSYPILKKYAVRSKIFIIYMIEMRIISNISKKKDTDFACSRPGETNLKNTRGKGKIEKSKQHEKKRKKAKFWAIINRAVFCMILLAEIKRRQSKNKLTNEDMFEKNLHLPFELWRQSCDNFQIVVKFLSTKASNVLFNENSFSVSLSYVITANLRSRLSGGMKEENCNRSKNESPNPPHLTEKEIKMIVESWLRMAHVYWGWIDEFFLIIGKYAKYFRELKIFQGHSNRVTCAQFSPDGQTIVSSSNDQTIRVGVDIWSTIFTRWLYHCVIFGGCCNSNMGFEIWLRSFKIGRPFGSCNKAQFSPDGHAIVSSSYDKTIRIWDLTAGKLVRTLKGHFNVVTGAQFSPNSRTIVSSSWDKTIRLWDVESGKELQKLEGHPTWVRGAQFSPNGRIVVSFSFETIRLWDVASGREIQKLEGHSDIVTGAQFLPDSSTVVSCSVDKTIRIWDVTSGQEIQKLEGHSKVVTGLDVTPDGDTIVSSSDDFTIRLWG
ncbi:WD-40 repeat protein, partial [Reticulomyxa filosa]